ncbi:MAG: hypothetical protein LN588_06075 [Rickettsia endosymbiont of Bryobia graminum]|nr:hypothetical protein [Rickettsia endosymbiont of Bryobia graminum]
MTFVYIFAHSSILRRKRPGIYPKEIKSKGVNINDSVNGITSLEYAIGSQGGDNIETLIKNGALYNSIDAKRTTPLHLRLYV